MISYQRRNAFVVLWAMSRSRKASKDVGAWFIEAHRVQVASLVRQRGGGHDDDRAKSGRIVIVTFVFLLLLAAGLLIGGRAAIGPLLESAITGRQANATGDLVYTMPDGVFCRRMSFDNVTAEVNESGIERCSEETTRRPITNKAISAFRWRGNN
jgi:hypothetical protein